MPKQNNIEEQIEENLHRKGEKHKRIKNKKREMIKQNSFKQAKIVKEKKHIPLNHWDSEQ